MSAPADTTAAWHPDPNGGGGTAYWDGKKWTGDRRPPRRAFAAAAGNGVIGGLPAFIGASFALLCVMVGAETGSAVYGTVAIPIVVVSLGISVYLLRGRGPTTQEVEARLAKERKEAKAKRRAANLWGSVAALERIVRPRSSASASVDSAEAAQINAIADPGTSRALQNLQNLLYTRTITGEEFQAAKDKLLREPTDTFAHITKLAELREAGILGDVEFSAAKAKALGL